MIQWYIRFHATPSHQAILRVLSKVQTHCSLRGPNSLCGPNSLHGLNTLPIEPNPHPNSKPKTLLVHPANNTLPTGLIKVKSLQPKGLASTKLYGSTHYCSTSRHCSNFKCDSRQRNICRQKRGSVSPPSQASECHTPSGHRCTAPWVASQLVMHSATCTPCRPCRTASPTTLLSTQSCICCTDNQQNTQVVSVQHDPVIHLAGNLHLMKAIVSVNLV